MKTYFISGPSYVDSDFWNPYLLVLEKLIPVKDEVAFVLGDFRGVDSLAQEWLRANGFKNVTVYHMFEKPRYNFGDHSTRGGFKSDDERDTAMTENSDYDICFLDTRTSHTKKGKSRVSGTMKNILRRIEKNLK